MFSLLYPANFRTARSSLYQKTFFCDPTINLLSTPSSWRIAFCRLSTIIEHMYSYLSCFCHIHPQPEQASENKGSRIRYL